MLTLNNNPSLLQSNLVVEIEALQRGKLTCIFQQETVRDDREQLTATINKVEQQ